MNKAAPHIITKDGEKVVGYALVMLKSFAELIPVLQPMFDKLANISYEQRPITDRSFYVMGQICIGRRYRGKGVFEALYKKHDDMFGHLFELCVTSVSTSNMRSMRAHDRIGFQVIHTFRDTADEWKILVRPLSAGKSDRLRDGTGNYDRQKNAIP
jgi:hypothetical protein